MADNKSAFSADGYDKNIRETLPYYEEFFRQVTGAVRAYKSEAVSWLDAGCGTGEMARAALEAVPIERFVFCDISEKMLSIAESRFAAPNREFYRRSVQSMLFEREFDVVTAIMINHYLNMREREKAAQSCFKALKKDGMYFCFENFAPSCELGTGLYLERWRRFQLEQGRSEEECGGHLSRYGKEYFPVTIDEEMNILKSCGFRAVEILWVSFMQAGFLAIK